MFGHVTSGLHGEELGRQHQSGFAVPVRQAPFGRLGVEGSARVLVEADGDSKIELARLYRAVGAEHGRSARGAAVGDIDELKPREAQLGDHGVGVARRVRATIGELDIAPLQPGGRQGLAHGEDALLKSGQAGGAAKGMDAGGDDADGGHAEASGVKA